MTHKLENNYIAEVLPQEWVLRLTSGSPAWGSGIGRRIPQSIWLYGQQGLYTGAPQDWGNQRPHSKSCTYQGEGISCDSAEAWTRPTCWSWGWYSGEAGEEGKLCLSLGSSYSWWQKISGSVDLLGLLLEAILLRSLAPRPGPTQLPKSSSAEMP